MKKFYASKLKNRALLLSVAALLAACGKQATTEEVVLVKTFSSYTLAESYDQVCQNGRLTSLHPDSKQVDQGQLYMFGNMQLIAARIGAVMHAAEPALDVKTGVQRIADMKKKVEDKAEARLKGEGCDNADAKAAAKALLLFSSVPPWQVSGMIDQEIQRQGGTITPPPVPAAATAPPASKAPAPKTP